MVANRKVIPGEIMAEPEEILGKADDSGIVGIDPGAGGDVIVYQFLNPDEEQDTLPTPDIENEDPLETKFYRVSSPKQLGEALSAERSKFPLTKVAVAEAMGTSEGSVRRVEKGSNPQRWDTIQRYAQVLGKEIEIRFVDP